MAELLRVNNLKTYFDRYDGVVKAVDGVSYKVDYGETLAIVGESGSGKTQSVLSLLRLIKGNGRIVDGEAIFEGKDLLKLSKEELRQIRGKDISIVFQDPMTSLNPIMRIGIQIMEPILWHKIMSDKEARERAIELLRVVGIPEYKTRVWDYPFQFSGGMRQRVMIAIALACNPKLVIADEPTTALDVTVRAQILNLLSDMKEEFKTSVIFITHDVTLAMNFADTIMVMYAGKIAEYAPIDKFIRNPLHPYSNGLISSTLDINAKEGTLKPIPGNPPSLVNPPSGCRFHPRCPYAQDICKEVEPEYREVEDGHYVACHLVKGGKFNA
ncbi:MULTISPECIES: ABC transporter ATP-binding protein [Dictyoglomus]|jgi:oligopeptide/dipeptide ABC transporter ATP-binding protein|uniref:Oligopeptide/dipeptide ABC transporter, ATPase subunit n=1 Tax=Dictyoglomus turgidum (strain DSM 6724 / Z-1310) TaxID=515635 RepID=B8DZL9_DICTD|nr:MULTISPECIES: ABC transporter ATP-binding protein [Dictyoglomus]ACK41952.1 oligopeptide/dipeptide ABC transporter, ATPase subunit [Dictyoglomus turgidum DSM 6724]HBU31488.1 ABC transporter ATP-binding protein [Dictyoglomus sp.]